MSASSFFPADEAKGAVLLGEQCPLLRYDEEAVADGRHLIPSTPLAALRPQPRVAMGPEK